jgi:DNA-binding transcriptional ArsR family regulator
MAADSPPPNEPFPAGDVVEVRDPTALRALTHPLRLRLLGLLRLHGPSTATLLASRVGESSGATSYHLRELARFGFVDEVAGRGTGRERWWQALHRMTDWEATDFQEDGREVADELHRHLAAQRGRLLSAWLAQRERLGPRWDAAAGLNDYALRLTPEQARALADEVTAVVDRWAEQHPAAQPAAGSELVSVVVDVLPLREWPL